MSSGKKVIGAVIFLCVSAIAGMIAYNPFSLTNVGIGITYEPFDAPGPHFNISSTYIELYDGDTLEQDIHADHVVLMSEIEAWLQDDSDSVWQETPNFARAQKQEKRYISLRYVRDHLTEHGHICDMEVYKGVCVCFGRLNVAQSYPPSYGCDGPNVCKEDREIVCR